MLRRKRLPQWSAVLEPGHGGFTTSLSSPRLSPSGQPRPIHDVRVMSACAPTATESLHCGKCRDGPEPDILMQGKPSYIAESDDKMTDYL